MVCVGVGGGVGTKVGGGGGARGGGGSTEDKKDTCHIQTLSLCNIFFHLSQQFAVNVTAIFTDQFIP